MDSLRGLSFGGLMLYIFVLVGILLGDGTFQKASAMVIERNQCGVGP